MIIAGLQKVTLIDYPSRVACTVFLAGCNFRCPWCYSSELVLPEKIEKQPKTEEKDFFSFLDERKGFLDGVVICGGEPLINKDLPLFIKKIKEKGFLVKIDTNGSNPQMIEGLLDFVDYVAMDVKLPKERYGEIFSDNSLIQKSIDILRESKKDFEFRTTVVPGMHSKEDLVKIAEWIKGPDVKYYLQNFRAEKTLDPEFEKVKPYPIEFLEEIKREIGGYFKVCDIR
ncbi:MAG: anaerobic ribonucleoside-triphosphate reductase activating protein [Candidatus Nealsonbacteria bacterium RIFOXYC1_FULL_40_7]|uniref:Anaerobic ribonucleoside-triphosphate reductase activating protein n=1 Tax=Candidatus Nealsonbacteria bacterium RIFOXYC1_FULL_40_7 TaxID=1801678 RepID=A0A1G2EQM0_9BACT|nr:MAG: anaerobic ribonucleoside-triphosphate reductase activating protein [Candidatus Nealsonbacteria bacterium RIFOXYC1_FULL_40_7]OGZ28544.1 MAG: anaerobic ribonucleoside-triphosphate reductase activating protein [Candidatus Nealsonbacteria bacterium RIFOXYD1_FULL_39_11]